MFKRETLTYPIVETFHSIQGEGFWHGVNAFFIRLGGCDVYCPWCDQKESWVERGYPQREIGSLVQEAIASHSAIVIITGGEPLIHDLEPLTTQLQRQQLKVHLETSGAHPFSGNFDWVTFSPKPFKLPHSSIYTQVNELKVVVATTDDLEWAEEQAKHLSSNKIECLKYLQPEWDTPDSYQLIVKYVLNHPDWRISLQTHKFLGIR